MKMKKLASVLAAALMMTAVPVTSQAETTYEEKDSGTNMGQSFTGSATVTFGQTPSFTVKIPKTIILDTDGAGKYTVGVKGQIPSKYAVSVVPDETITMEEENGLLDDITADVTAGKTEWKAAELNPDTYAENTENTIQMQSIDYGKFEGTLNFNVSAEIPVELKDASDAVKAGYNYLGEHTMKKSGITGLVTSIKSNVFAGDIVYITEAFTSGTYGDVSHEPGYYKIVTPKYFKSGSEPSDTNSMAGIVLTYGSTTYFEYLGNSYQVSPNVSVVELIDASDTIKSKYNFKGRFGSSSMNIVSAWVTIPDVSVGDVVYCAGGTKSNGSQTWTIKEGYYRVLSLNGGSMVVSSVAGDIDNYTEYLGTSYLVKGE